MIYKGGELSVNNLTKQVSSILTPQTDNFYRDIRIYGHVFHNTNDIMWWGDVGMKFLARAPFDVRWLREKGLDDPYGGFLYETTVEDKVLIGLTLATGIGKECRGVEIEICAAVITVGIPAETDQDMLQTRGCLRQIDLLTFGKIDRHNCFLLLF